MQSYLAGKRLLVTGGAGFIGSHLVRRLVSEGANVTVLEKEGSSLWRLTQNGCRNHVVFADISDESEVLHVFESLQPSGVFHLAAYGVDSAQQNILQAVSVNVNGMVNVLEAMKASGCERIVAMGSGAEYGNHKGPVSEDTILHPENAYASTKAAATLISHQYAAQNGIGIVTLRPFGVYGEAEPRHKIFCHTILSMLRGEALNLTPCTQCRDYCYVGDIVNALVAAYQNDTLCNDVFNLGTGCVFPLRDYIEKIRLIIKPKSQVNYGALPHRTNEQWSPTPDVHHAAQKLKWSCTCNLDESLKKTIDWFRENDRFYE